MIHIFYFIGILFIIYEFYSIINVTKSVDGIYKFIELSKGDKGKDLENMSSEYRSLLIGKGCPTLVFLMWFFIGLMTFNWVAFAGFIFLQFFLMQPIMKRVKYTVFYTYMYFINSLIGLTFGLFVLINHYHLKIDLQPYVIDLFNSIFS